MVRVTTGAIACTADQHLLGEGARWDARRGELLRVDILDGRVYRDLVADDGSLISVRTYEVPGTVGAARRSKATRAGCWPPASASPTCPRTARCARSPRSRRPARG